ncbi:hypothetical protein ASD83_13550 [Devosia sp. Root685]|uniref:hypothetical protein n=1 Tax=Devosia sp. Root685 TaxID=1736587 RepID=UPI0006F2CCB9|nr:hypothetical protein [Devosia sp. Root685]KRA98077.1 hypothetical protein ASD83_13550 [Devosia sp. Root685]
MIKPATAALAIALFATSGVYADPATNNGGGKRYELVDGTSFNNAGAMFQHLRDRDNGYASGNPKGIVEAYPEEFENVGDLIHDKRVD